MANGELSPEPSELRAFAARGPAVLDDFVKPPHGWPRFIQDCARAFGNLLGAAAKGYPLSSPKPPKQSTWAVFDEKAHRFIEKEDFRLNTLPTRLMVRLYDLVLQHGHLLAHCEAPEPMKRGRRPRGARKEKPTGKLCGRLFLGKRIGQRYCSAKCANRAAGQRKKAKKRRK